MPDELRRESSQRMRRNQGDHSVSTKSKPVHPVGQPISASMNSGFKAVRRVSEEHFPGIGIVRTWRPSRPFTGTNERLVDPSF